MLINLKFMEQVFLPVKISKKGQKIIQYVGEKITKAEGDKRSALRIKNYLNSSKLVLYIYLN